MRSSFAAARSASATTAVTNITAALSTGNVEGAWNAAVAGLLGPTGVPGSIVNLTLGAGVQIGDVNGSATYNTNFVPSVRNEVQTLGQGLSVALSSTAATPAAAVRSAATKAVPAAATEGAADAAAPAKHAPAKVGRHAAAATAAAAK